MKLSFTHKRSVDRTIEERKYRPFIRGKRMRKDEHYVPECASAPMVDRNTKRMVISDDVEHGWLPKHLEVHRAFLHEE